MALVDLMDETELVARRSMAEDGIVPARLYICSQSGVMTLAMNPLKGELSKKEFVGLAKLACVAVGADASVFVAEAWMFNAIPGEPPRLPSETMQGKDAKEMVVETGVRPDGNLLKKARDPRLDVDEQISVLQDRKEVVILMGEASGYGEQRIMPIQRSADGKHVSLGRTEKLQDQQFQGEFANFISEDCRDARQRALAENAFADHGINLEKLSREGSHLNDRRRETERGM